MPGPSPSSSGASAPVTPRSPALCATSASLGAYEEARALHARDLAIRERSLGPDHPAVANVLANLAQARDDVGAHDEARSLYERSLAIRERTLGPEHPAVAESLDGLASARAALHDAEAASELHARALAIYARAFGPDNLAVTESLIGLARDRRAMGQSEEARALARRALAIRALDVCEAALPSRHPKIAGALLVLAEVARGQGQLAEAALQAGRAVEILEAGAAPPETLAAARALRGRVQQELAVAGG